MLAKLKVQKRRIEEQLLQATGVTKGTHDQEFKKAEMEFHNLERKLVDIGVQTKAVMDATSKWTSSLSMLSESFRTFHTPLTSEPSALYAEPAKHVAYLSNAVHVQTTGSINQAIKDRVYDPIMRILTTEFPIIKERIKERENILIDHDSHKRKLGSATAGTERFEKMTEKLAQDEKDVEKVTTWLMKRFKDLQDDKYTMLATEFTYFTCAQAAFLTHSSGTFNKALDSFPPESLDIPVEYIKSTMEKSGITDTSGHTGMSLLSSPPRGKPQPPSTSMLTTTNTTTTQSSSFDSFMEAPPPPPSATNSSIPSVGKPKPKPPPPLPSGVPPPFEKEKANTGLGGLAALGIPGPERIKSGEVKVEVDNNSGGQMGSMEGEEEYEEADFVGGGESNTNKDEGVRDGDSDNEEFTSVDSDGDGLEEVEDPVDWPEEDVYIASYDYEADEYGFLSFTEGDEIFVVTRDTKSGKWTGITGGKKGFFKELYALPKKTIKKGRMASTRAVLS